MAKEETDITSNIRIDLSGFGVRVFKNVRGMFYTLDKKRKVKAGLMAPGASDLIGGTPVLITPDMVGRTIAVFTVIEVKTKDGKASGDQGDFITYVREMGGFAGVARNPQEARRICKIPVDAAADTAV